VQKQKKTKSRKQTFFAAAVLVWFLRYARQAFALMSYANSCVNPVVYAFMSRNFRAGFRKAIGCNSSAFMPPRAHAQTMGGSPRMRHVTYPAANCSAEISMFIHEVPRQTGVLAVSRDNLAPSAEQ